MGNKEAGKGVPVVVLTTSQTSTTGMLAMLSYTTVASGDVTAVLAGFRVPSRHFCAAPASIITCGGKVQISTSSRYNRCIQPVPVEFGAKKQQNGVEDDWGRVSK